MAWGTQRLQSGSSVTGGIWAHRIQPRLLKLKIYGILDFQYMQPGTAEPTDTYTLLFSIREARTVLSEHTMRPVAASFSHKFASKIQNSVKHEHCHSRRKLLSQRGVPGQTAAKRKLLVCQLCSASRSECICIAATLWKKSVRDWLAFIADTRFQAPPSRNAERARAALQLSLFKKNTNRKKRFLFVASPLIDNYALDLATTLSFALTLFFLFSVIFYVTSPCS